MAAWWEARTGQDCGRHGTLNTRPLVTYTIITDIGIVLHTVGGRAVIVNSANALGFL